MTSSLPASPLLKDLSLQDILMIEELGHIEEFEPGKQIIQEGEISTDLYLILSGEVKVKKSEEGKDLSYSYDLATLKKGDVFGEFGFVESYPRSASVFSMSKVVTLKLEKDDFKEEEKGGLYKKILSNIVRMSVGRLRDQNSIYAESLEKTAEQIKQQKSFGLFFLAVFFSITLLPGVSYILELIGLDLRGDVTSIIRLVVAGIPAVLFLIINKYPFREAGFSLVGWPKAVLEGIVLGLLLGAFNFFAYVYVHGGTIHEFFNRLVHGSYLGTWLLVYPFHVYLQESMLRGVFQFSLQRFTNDKLGFMTILINSLIFASVHTQWDIYFILSIFFGNLILGYIYLIRRNILELTVIHTIVGLILLNIGEASSVFSKSPQ